MKKLAEEVYHLEMKHSEKEKEWQNEKQILLNNLNIEREKYRLLTTRIFDAVKDSNSIAQTQLLALSDQPENAVHEELEQVNLAPFNDVF